MSENAGEYDLKPEEPKAVPPASSPSASGQAPNAGTPAAGVPSAEVPGMTGTPAGVPGAGGPVMPAVPPGFVPPTPVVLGPNDEDPDIKDAEENRVVAILAYVPGFFLLPLLFAPKSRFARYHANQGLLVFITAVAVFVLMIVLAFVNEVVPHIPGLGFLATPLTVLHVCGCLVEILLVVLVAAMGLVGVINASNGERKPLPVVGKVTLIKERPGMFGGVTKQV